MYLKDTYILGRKIRRSRAGIIRGNPIFPPALWSVLQRAEMRLPTTNNFLESWHRRLKELIVHDHPSFYVELQAIQYDQRHTETTIMRINLGECLKRETHEMAQHRANIEYLISTRDEHKNIDFLRAIAHNFTVDSSLSDRESDQIESVSEIEPFDKSFSPNQHVLTNFSSPRRTQLFDSFMYSP